jgi:hypothetical protein
MLIVNGGNGQAVPPPRTNHSVISWQDKLYLFGGTDGTQWFNDVWTYDPTANAWTELDCIGYIPAPREGHSAALINDTMYIFGGRIQDGTDLGDLVAFKISTRRWYMFQNMGMSPSPRSGHSMTAFGNHIMVLAGEPSSAPRDPTELSLGYVLDTTKIRYPTNEPPASQPLAKDIAGAKELNYGDRAPAVQKPGSVPILTPQPGTSRPESPQINGVNQQGSRPPTRSMNQAIPQGPPQSKIKDAAALRAKTPSRGATTPSFEQQRDDPRDLTQNDPRSVNGVYQSPQSALQTTPKPSSTAPSRSGSRLARQQASVDSDARETPRASIDTPTTNYSREINDHPVDSGVGASPALSQATEELVKELEVAKIRNAWYASELAMARKAGYQPTSSGNPILDQQAADMFGEDDRPLIEALLRMKAELTRVQGSIESQSDITAARIAEIEKQRDVAISEAVYAKAKLAAHGGSGSNFGSPQPDGLRGASASPDIDRANDMSRRLATALNAQKDLTIRLESIQAELDSERRARSLANETSEAAEKRISELDSYKQRTTAEVESLRAELHEAQRVAREESANCADAVAAHKLTEADNRQLLSKHGQVMEETRGHTTILQTLRDAVRASTDKADHLTSKLDEERQARSSAEQRFVQLKTEHDQRAAEVGDLNRRLQDAEDLAQKHAQEAKMHREAVLSGLGAVTTRSIDNEAHVDERVDIMTQQLEAANAMSRQNKDSADSAAERLRSAEERIAGLEAYQEQTSRENLTIRKQAQMAMKEAQTLRAEKTEIQQRLERAMLDGNALEVQLKTLKNLLEERGINAADTRRSRILESPGSRYGTPDLNRIRELERQLDESLKAHEEMRQTFESREQDTTREWEEKLQALTNDHQESNKYVRALEKYLTKMKAELQKTKSAQSELEKELQIKPASSPRSFDADAAAKEKEWHAEREVLRKEISDVEDNLKGSIVALESQIGLLRSSLGQAEADRENLRQSQAEHDAHLKAVTDSARAELDTLQRENKALEVRCTDAEHKVQMFLDQVESSVDNYRRRSRFEQQHVRTISNQPGGSTSRGTDADSLYSTTTNEEDDEDDEEDRETETGDSPSSHHLHQPAAGQRRDRTSTALDSLTTELDALRFRWETTSRNYKLSDQFDFEKSPSSAPGIAGPSAPTGGPLGNAFTGVSGSGIASTTTTGGGRFPSWAKGLETDTESLASEESAEKLLATPPRPTPSAVTAAVTAAAQQSHAQQHGMSHPAIGPTAVTK